MSGSHSINLPALAELSRLALSAQEIERLEKELPAILDFVAEVQAVDTGEVQEVHEVVNVLREDAHPHEPGLYTEAFLEGAPVREGDYIKVRQVLKGGKHV